jgi:uracil-DNA glycosylase family 4
MKVLPLTDNRPFLYGDCDICPLSPPKIVRGYGVGDGIVIIGESPGRQEVVKGQPFVGPSGQLIRSVLRAYGQDPEEVYWTNSILCHAPPPPSKDATIACNGRLWQELRLVNPTKILLLGANALKAITDPKKPALITRERGRGFTVKVGDRNVYCVATYHPAAILRDPDLYRDLANDVYKLLTHDTVDTYRPEVYVCLNVKDTLRWLDRLSKASTVSCDIETEGLSVLKHRILSVGFGALHEDGSAVSVIIPAPILKDDKVKKRLVEFFES